MDSIRRCDDCRRVVHGEAGNACPYCGGGRLNRIVEHRDAVPQLHLPIFRLALSFCFGLATMQIAAFAMGLHAPTTGHAGPLWHLNILVGVCVATYWPVRRNEGDFRALFITSICLFALGEGLSALAHAYGMGSLRDLSGDFRNALLVFSSLALTAGATDTTPHTQHERTMFAASGGFLLLAIVHLILKFKRIENDAVEDFATIGIALVVAAYAAIMLFKEKAEQVPQKECLKQ